MIASTESCCATSAPTPANARLRARTASPPGKRSVGRRRTPSRCTGSTRGSARTATPAVVPQPSHAMAWPDNAATSFWSPPARPANTRKTTMTARLDRSGENACQKNRLCAWRMLPSTTASP